MTQQGGNMNGPGDEQTWGAVQSANDPRAEDATDGVLHTSLYDVPLQVLYSAWRGECDIESVMVGWWDIRDLMSRQALDALARECEDEEERKRSCD